MKEFRWDFKLTHYQLDGLRPEWQDCMGLPADLPRQSPVLLNMESPDRAR